MPSEFSADVKDDGMQRFSATGRPYKPRDQNDAMNGVMFGGEFTNGHGPANTLPFKYTDDSIIKIAVLPPSSIATKNLADEDDDDDDSLNPIKQDKKKGGFWRRMSSSAQGKSKKKDDFVMRDVKRGDYLKFYAKDDDGKYIGTEDPAPDCILNGTDLTKYGRRQ